MLAAVAAVVLAHQQLGTCRSRLLRRAACLLITGKVFADASALTAPKSLVRVAMAAVRSRTAAMALMVRHRPPSAELSYRRREPRRSR